jgi:hypothetical protein
MSPEAPEKQSKYNVAKLETSLFLIARVAARSLVTPS